ncbi:MAG: peptidase [Burkholderiales bacterium]|jgi:hypothetical protein|nr:peptidase [Burkholderiales bacterium]
MIAKKNLPKAAPREPSLLSLPPIEVFRLGDHTTSSGDRLSFSAADLAQMAASYDPVNAAAPIVVGHPKTDSPTYGWAGGFLVKGDKLIAEPKDVDAEFASLVKAKRFNKISFALFPPDHPSNPKPGGWYPRHIGFLGGAAPAITGLKPVTFAGDEGVIEFSTDYALVSAAGIFRRLREWFIETYGKDAADNVIREWDISEIEDGAEKPDPDPAPVPAFAASPNYPPKEEEMSEQDKERLAALEAENAALKASQRETALAARRAEFAALTETLTQDGRLPAAQVSGVIAFAMSLPDEHAVEFAAADGTKTATPGVTWFKQFLQSLPASVPMGEAARKPVAAPAVEFVAPRGEDIDADRAELHAKALAYQRQNNTDYLTAARAVGA